MTEVTTTDCGLWCRMALCVAVLTAPARLSAASHAFSARDMHEMDRLGELAVSPDGKQVAYVVRQTDFEQNRGRTDIYLIGIDGKGERRLTSHPDNDNEPRWAPDGKSIYFVSTRSGSSQVWRLPLDGGEPTQVTKLPLDVSSLLVSPDGKLLAFALELYPDCATIACTTARLEALKTRQATGQLYDKLFVRQWDSWRDGRRSHVCVMASTGGDVTDLMAGMDADAPSRPFGGPEEVSFTPDSKGLVFSVRDGAHGEAWSTNYDLVVAPVDGKGPRRNLTEANPAWDTYPTFSPDGRTLAYLAMVRSGFEADRRRIVLRAWPQGEPRVLTEGWDRSPDAIAWAPDGKTLYATADHLGQHAIFAVDIKSGTARPVWVDGQAGTPVPVGRRILFSLDHLKSPAELYSVNSDGTKGTQLTHLNATRLAQVRMGDFEQFSFKGWNDEVVDGYLVKPVDFVPGKKVPVAFLIHGGPQGSFGNHFHYRWNPQAYAGRGYAAVMVDFHGSTGYGQGFTDAIRGDWGGKPLVDLQKGLEAALARYSFLDGERVCALGASYGGYMINWIAGNWPERFRGLVRHDGNLDER
ncbi:MAG: S9 family peptidase, partial [Myxococcota bacterium]